MDNIYLKKRFCIFNCFRLIVGGQDGSVTILVVAQLEDENKTDEETIANTANYLQNLPSRRTHREHGARMKTGKESVESKENSEDEDDTSSLNTFEERMRDERRAEVRRRFRYVY